MLLLKKYLLANNGKFRFVLNRNYSYAGGNMMVIADSYPGIRFSVQPLIIKVIENTTGSSQVINFSKIPDVPAGTASVPLVASSTSGLFVDFFVDAGPAIIQNNKLVFTQIPPIALYPVSVTVTAWQWGINTAPLFDKSIVKQTFKIYKNPTLDIVPRSNKSESSPFTLSPNPVTDKLSVHADKVPNAGNITIYDGKSKVRHTQKITEYDTVINMDGIESGIYFVALSNGKEGICRKIIKR